jgi:hypothetical protein
MNWYSPDELKALASAVALTDVLVVSRFGSDRPGEKFSMGHELHARFDRAPLTISFDRVGDRAECRTCWSFHEDDPCMTVWIVRPENRGPPARLDRLVSTGVPEFDRAFAFECEPPRLGRDLIDRELALRLVDPAAAVAFESFVATRRGEEGVPGNSGWVRSATRPDAVAAGFEVVRALRDRIVAASLREGRA